MVSSKKANLTKSLSRLKSQADLDHPQHNWTDVDLQLHAEQEHIQSGWTAAALHLLRVMKIMLYCFAYSYESTRLVVDWIVDPYHLVTHNSKIVVHTMLQSLRQASDWTIKPKFHLLTPSHP